MNKASKLMEQILSSVVASDVSNWYRDFTAHHMGTYRMGDDPNTSVVDRNLKAHDVDNLFIVGISAFVTGGAMTPSLTIATLTIRAVEYIRRGHSRSDA
jgi:glucose dehydrogenase